MAVVCPPPIKISGYVAGTAEIICLNMIYS